MKDIRIQKLQLHNFKGMTFTLDTAGDNTDVFGANATGKTTLADAFSWLLFSKDSLGRAGFEIKNLDRDGNREHGMDHSVEAILAMDNAYTVTLKKVYHEVWSKKRGSAQSTLTSNTVDHSIDGVPVKENEYKARIAEIAGDETIFRLLTSPTVFPLLPWQKQRSLLLEVCGDVTDEQVIATDDSLSPLTDLLKRYTVSKTPLDDLKKVVTSRRTEINKQIDQLPVRIDEVFRGLPDIKGLDRDALTKQVQDLEAQVNDGKLRLQGIDNGGVIADLSKEIQTLNYDISQLENKYYIEGMRHVTKLNSQINELQGAVDDADRKQHSLKAIIKGRQSDLENIETRLTILREKWMKIDAETFQDGTSDTCPACGQPLPTASVQEARDKALAQFNQQKAERLSFIEQAGKRDAETKASYAGEIEKLYKDLNELARPETSSLDMLVAERDTLKALAEDYNQIPGRAELIEKKAGLEAQIAAARAGVSQSKEVIQKEIASLGTQLAEAKEKADRFIRREQGEKRVADLKAEEKKLAKEYEDLERQIFLIESFIKAKVAMLTEKINRLFEIVRFKLYNIQVNQGVAECCVATVSGVPYDSGLNSAARTQAGLDIIRTLQRHYGLNCPIWIDNRESVTEIPTMDCQLISLVVSPKDKALRIEKADAGKRAAA